MPQSIESTPGDQQLAAYLLGLLSEADTDRLDELSIADDDVAWRLRAVENDLVDAYVSGALAGNTRARFESFYLTSPLRRRKVKAAAGFQRAVDRAADHVKPQTRRPKDFRRRGLSGYEGAWWLHDFHCRTVRVRHRRNPRG